MFPAPSVGMNNISETGTEGSKVAVSLWWVVMERDLLMLYRTFSADGGCEREWEGGGGLI